ncbi:MAG TPA: preprotein translocase subunit YajC [Spirochaetota bacterium]|nr:preprotein translocase subunit YajC [Spirochaetota bacterium]
MNALFMLSQGCVPQGGAGAGQGGGGGSSIMFLVMMVAMIGIMYFVVYRPQAKARKKLEAAINEMKKGDRVLTAGGIYGTVVGTSETVVVLEIDKDKGVKIEVNKAMVSQVLPRE